MHAEKCPVCNGEGKVKTETCHGCAGRGWIEINDSQTPYVPYYPQPYVPYIPYPYEPYRDPYPWTAPYTTIWDGTAADPNTSACYTVPQDAQITYC